MKHSIYCLFRLKHLLLMGVTLALTARGADFSNVPGVVLDYQEITYSRGHNAQDVFISDPEILVLSNGGYIASHALAGWQSGSDTSGKTSIFHSSDKGVSWTQWGGIYNGILRGSLLEHDGALYLLGSVKDVSGLAVIIKSLDNGATWTTSTLDFYGPATPNNPAVLDGRIWSAAGRGTGLGHVRSVYHRRYYRDRQRALELDDRRWFSRKQL